MASTWPELHSGTNFNYVWDVGTLAWVKETQASGGGGGVAATIADGADVAEGATTDAAVVTDAAGTVSGKLRGLVKWAFERMPAALGQTTMAGSLPVTLASNQSALPVTGTFFQATQPVSAAALPLPAGASTLAEQQTQTTALQLIDNIVSGAGANITQLGGTNVSMNTGVRDAGTQRVTVATNDLVPVSAASLPLPTGAASAALQTQPGIDIGDVTINNAADAAAVNVQDGGNSITVDGAATSSPATTDPGLVVRPVPRSLLATGTLATPLNSVVTLTLDGQKFVAFGARTTGLVTSGAITFEFSANAAASYNAVIAQSVGQWGTFRPPTVKASHTFNLDSASAAGLQYIAVLPPNATHFRLRVSTVLDASIDVYIGASDESNGAGAYTTNQGTRTELQTDAWLTQVSDGTTGPVAVKAASTAAVAADKAYVVAISPNNTIPANVTQFGSTNVSTGTGAGGAGIPRVTVSSDSNVIVTPPTLTKGTQGSTGFSTQDLKDASRNVTNYFHAVPILTTVAEVMQTLTGYKSGAAVAATATPAVVTAGKTYRINLIAITYVGATAIGSARVNLRANLTGVGVVGSPLVHSWQVGVPAVFTAGNAMTYTFPFPDGLEFAAGTGIAVGVIGEGAVPTTATIVGYVMIAIHGYEY